MKTITKKDLVDRIADGVGQKRVVVKRIVQQFLDEIVEELGNGNRLEFRDFGVFEIRERAARVAQNPKTMEKVPVPRKRTVKFKIGRLMKEQLHKSEEHAAKSMDAAEVAAASDNHQPRIAEADVADVTIPFSYAAKQESRQVYDR